MPLKITVKYNFLLSWKLIPIFEIISVQRVSLKRRNYILAKEKEFFCW